MPSKLATDNLKSTTFVVSSATSNRDLIAKEGARLLALPGKEAEVERALKVLLDNTAGTLTATTADLVAKDDALQHELADDKALLEERDAAQAELFDFTSGFREVVLTSFGTSMHAKFGFTSGETPSDPVELTRLGDQLLTNIAGIQPLKTKLGVIFNPGDYRATLEKLTKRLKAAVPAVVEDVRQDQAARAARDTAAEKNAKTFSRGANLLSALLRAGGLEALADQVRPSGRKPGTIAEPEAVPAASPAAPAPS
jgi:hypothetical protein